MISAAVITRSPKMLRKDLLLETITEVIGLAIARLVIAPFLQLRSYSCIHDFSIVPSLTYPPRRGSSSSKSHAATASKLEFQR